MSAIERVATFAATIENDYVYTFGMTDDPHRLAVADLQSILADARRLQWLEDIRVDCETLASGWILDSEHWKPTLREVIDDAMEQSK